MGVDKAFSALDTKGDNKISPEELSAFFKDKPAGLLLVEQVRRERRRGGREREQEREQERERKREK